MKRHAIAAMLALAATACGPSSSPTAPPVPVCTTVTTPAVDRCDTVFYSNGSIGLACYTVPASTSQVCK